MRPTSFPTGSPTKRPTSSQGASSSKSNKSDKSHKSEKSYKSGKSAKSESKSSSKGGKAYLFGAGPGGSLRPPSRAPSLPASPGAGRSNVGIHGVAR